ncbi:flagellar hook-basal body complex protein FliE [uncultured Cohaesibacter sp.]|uniref:flagellar hook-basal body complex protein FliE n=1 Tax=uncultured Cohaesibacter sp. TaxID=1002546 RepID=UPI002AAAE51E|nr:flagellar hook-basal body complex protein FliE [uncultured Cohaesibacter sp.]
MIDSLNSVSSLTTRGSDFNGVSETRFISNGGSTAAIDVTGEVDESGNTFADYFSGVTTDAINTVKMGETAAIEGIEGKESVQNVVDAVMNAELALQSAIAIRDKVVAAYQEVSRMTI